MSTTAFSAELAAKELRDRLGSEKVLVSGLAYEEARRIWNRAVDRRPALIVRPESAVEVQTAVLAARTHNLALSVRGGGHDWMGRALRDGGLVIDLTRMRHVAVDQGARVATVGGGAVSDDLINAITPSGVVAAAGAFPDVGVAGLTLGGGYGPFAGRLGLAVDNLLGADVVLADGRLVTTDAQHEPELYWALRGGGGNFGVVTAMRIRLHPLPRMWIGMIVYPWSEADVVWNRLREVLSDAPDELTVQHGAMAGPDGEPALYLLPAWCGDLARGERPIQELTQLGTPLMSQVAPISYAERLDIFKDSHVPETHYAVRTRSVAALDPDVISVLIESASSWTAPRSSVLLHHFHGFPARVPVEDTAFGIRQDHLVVEIVAGWEPDPDPARHHAWLESVSTALVPHALPGGYASLLGPDSPEQIAHAYGPNAARLRAAKARFDPEGIFSSALLLPPTPTPGA